MPEIKLPPIASLNLPPLPSATQDDTNQTPATPAATSGIKLPDLKSLKLPPLPTAPADTSGDAPEASWYNVVTKSLSNMPTRAQRAWEGIKQGIAVQAQNTAQGVTGMTAQNLAKAAQAGVEGATAQMAQLGVTPDQVLPNDNDSYETKLAKNKALYAMIDKMKVANLQQDPDFVASRDKALKLSGEIAANTPHTDEWSAKGIVSAITGATADMAGPIGLAMLTRSPAVGLGTMTGQAYGQYYQDSIDKGLNPVQAQDRATVFAAMEPLTEAVPLGLIMKKGANALSDLGKSAIAEGAQEAVTQALQNGYDIGVLNDKMTVGEFLKDVAYNGIVGAGAGGAIHGTIHAPGMLSGKSGETVADTVNQNAPGQTVPVPEGEYDAMAAEAGTVPPPAAPKPEVTPDQFAAYQAQRQAGAAPRDALDALKQQVAQPGAEGDALSQLASQVMQPRDAAKALGYGLDQMQIPAYLRQQPDDVAAALRGENSKTPQQLVEDQLAQGDVGPTPGETLGLPAPGKTSVIAMPGEIAPPVDMTNRTQINSPVDERAPSMASRGVKPPSDFSNLAPLPGEKNATETPVFSRELPVAQTAAPDVRAATGDVSGIKLPPLPKPINDSVAPVVEDKNNATETPVVGSEVQPAESPVVNRTPDVAGIKLPPLPSAPDSTIVAPAVEAKPTMAQRGRETAAQKAARLPDATVGESVSTAEETPVTPKAPSVPFSAKKKGNPVEITNQMVKDAADRGVAPGAKVEWNGNQYTVDKIQGRAARLVDENGNANVAALEEVRPTEAAKSPRIREATPAETVNNTVTERLLGYREAVTHTLSKPLSEFESREALDNEFHSKYGAHLTPDSKLYDQYADAVENNTDKTSDAAMSQLVNNPGHIRKDLSDNQKDQAADAALDAARAAGEEGSAAFNRAYVETYRNWGKKSAAARKADVVARLSYSPENSQAESFTEGMKPAARANALKHLSKESLSLDGTADIEQRVRQYVDKGAVVERGPFGHDQLKVQGSYALRQDTVGKTGVEYGKHLIAMRDAKPAAESDAFVPRAQYLVDQAKVSAAMRKPIASQKGRSAVDIVASGFTPDAPNHWQVIQRNDGTYGIKDNPNSSGSYQTTKAVYDLYNQVKDLNHATLSKKIPSVTKSAPSSKKSLTPAQVTKAYQSFTKDMKGAENLKFTVVEKQSELGLPDDGSTYMAFYNPGGVEVIAVAENLHSEEEAHAQFRHEIIAHYGLRARLSKEQYDAQMDRITAAEGKDKRLDPYFKQVRENYADVYDQNSPDGQRMIAEEVVAAVAENPAEAQKIGVVRQVLEAIRKMLVKAGLLTDRATYQDVADLVKANTEYLRKTTIDPDDVRRSIAPMRFETPNDMSPSLRKDRRVEDAVAPDDIKEGMRKVLHVEEGSLTSTINAIMDNNVRKEAAHNAYQSMVDDLSPIAQYERMKTGGDLNVGAESAYKMATNSRQINSIIASAMNVGTPMWSPKGDIVTRPGTKGLMQIFEPIAKMKGNQLALWEYWAGAVRANRLLKEGRENLYTQEDVDKVTSYVNSKPELRKAFNEAHKEYQQFKTELLDFAEQSGTLDPAARKIWDKDDYVPLYRVADELDRTTAPGGAGRSFTNQSTGIKTLKGGTGKVDIINNILRNASHMIQSSYNNRVGQMVVDLAEGIGMEKVPVQFKPVDIKNAEMKKAMNELGISINGMDKTMSEEYSKMFTTAPPVGKDIVSVMFDGKRQYYRVTDPSLMRAINQVGPRTVNTIMRVLGWPKQLLTRTVTATPGFVLRNITRDILGNYVTQTQAAGRRGVGQIIADSLTMRPIITALKGSIDTIRESGNVHAYRQSGGFSGGYDGARPDALAKQLRGMTKENFLKKSVHKLVGGFEKGLEAGEMGTRMAVYNDVLKKTGSVTEAAYQANDVMNFSRRGDSQVLSFFLNTVPFMNARIQGFDRLVRGAKDDSRSFMLKGALIAAGTMALMAMNRDDERYWALNEQVRNNYWIIPTQGGFVQIPKPFEVGTLFGTVLERGYEAATRDDKVFWNSMQDLALNTFAMNPIPQAISPIVQDVFNKDFFMDRPIVSEGMKYQEAPDQADAYTPQLLADLAKKLPESFPDFLRSPVRLQHLLEGYTGSVGQYVLASADSMYRMGVSDNVSPARPEGDYPVADIFRKPDNKSSKYVSRVYDMQQMTRKANATIKTYKERHDYDGVEAARDKYADEIGASKGIEKAAKRLSDLSRQSKDILADSTLTAEEKRTQLDAITVKKNEIAKTVNDKYWRELKK